MYLYTAVQLTFIIIEVNMEFGGDLIYVGKTEEDEIPEEDDIEEQIEESSPQNGDEEVKIVNKFLILILIP